MLKRANKTIVTERRGAPKPVPTPASGVLTEPEPEEVGAIARFPGQHDLPEQAGTIVVLAPPKQRGGPSLAYTWDRKSEHTSLLFSRKSRLVQELHSLAIGRDGRQYYLSWNEPTLVEADQDGERRVFTHTTYVRDLALDEDDNIYFSEASGAGSQGKIYRLVPATDKAAAQCGAVLHGRPARGLGLLGRTLRLRSRCKGKAGY